MGAVAREVMSGDRAPRVILSGALVAALSRVPILREATRLRSLARAALHGDRALGMRLLVASAATLAVMLALWGFAGLVQGAEQQVPTHQAPAVVAVKTALATEGAVASNLSYTGDVKAVSQVSVLPKATGRIERLPMDVGSRVRKGDTIAELDSASLEAQVGQARANLAAASAKYSSMEAGSRAEQIAQAKANLDSARERLASMEQGGRAEQVAQAKAALDAANARASLVKKGAAEADTQAAQSAVDSAAANLQIAKARLETLKQGPTQSEWGSALGAVDSARANWQAAEARLADLKAGPKQADLQAAQAAVDGAKASLNAAEDRLAYVKDNGTPITSWGFTGTSVGQVEASVKAAQASYDAAVESQNLLRSMPLPADLQAAQSAVDAAKASFDAAAARVDQMKRGATEQDLQQAEGAVKAAEATLASAQARLKQVKEGPTAEDLAIVQASVAQAEQGLALAERPYGEHDVAQARNAVVGAQQQYNLVADPYTENDLAVVKASVLQAQAALEMAELALGEAVVVSPMDGVVADRHQSVGALVSPATPLVSVISPDVELVLGVEESQIGRIEEGQGAEIAVAAYPGELFRAKVDLIAPAADPKSRTFRVRVRPVEGDGRLRQGMFAQVKVVTAAREKAVLVPKEAVVTRSGESAVFVLKGEIVELRPVKLGLAGNGTVEIASGLEVGEEVVVAGQSGLRDGDKVRRS